MQHLKKPTTMHGQCEGRTKDHRLLQLEEDLRREFLWESRNSNAMLLL
jgi:hypothetical protein